MRQNCSEPIAGRTFVWNWQLGHLGSNCSDKGHAFLIERLIHDRSQPSDQHDRLKSVMTYFSGNLSGVTPRAVEGLWIKKEIPMDLLCRNVERQQFIQQTKKRTTRVPICRAC